MSWDDPETGEFLAPPFLDPQEDEILVVVPRPDGTVDLNDSVPLSVPLSTYDGANEFAAFRESFWEGFCGTVNPVKDSLPSFTADRGGIKWNNTPSPPPSRWQKRKWRWNGKIRGARHSLALRIAPWLDRDWD